MLVRFLNSMLTQSCLMAAVILSNGCYLGFRRSPFYNWKYLNCIGMLSFLRFIHTFSLFLKSNWSSDFGHAETGSGAKKRVVLRREIFAL